MVVGDTAGQLVASFDYSRLGVLVCDAEVGNAGLKGSLGGGFAGSQMICDPVFGYCSGDCEGVALVLEVFDLGLDDSIEFLFKIGQEVLQDCSRLLATKLQKVSVTWRVRTSGVSIAIGALLGRQLVIKLV